MAYDNLKYTDDAVIISNIVADTDSENYMYLDEINRISLLCKSSGLLLNPTETTGATPPPPNFEQLSLNGTVITPSTILNYLSAAMDNKLRFQTYIADKVSIAQQRLHLVISTNLCERNSKSIR